MGCGMCQGDCDSDADCESGLKCFQRDGSESIFGCISGGVGDVKTHDYCYQEEEAACTLQAPNNGALSDDCPDGLGSGGTCKPICNTGYELHGEFQCKKGELTKTATCEEKPCTLQAPDHASLSDTCPNGLKSGETCTPICNTGYDLQGEFKCEKGEITKTATCKKKEQERMEEDRPHDEEELEE